MNATVLYERMISLRNISHTQMLHARGMIYRYIKAHVCIYIPSLIHSNIQCICILNIHIHTYKLMYVNFVCVYT